MTREFNILEETGRPVSNQTNADHSVVSCLETYFRNSDQRQRYLIFAKNIDHPKFAETFLAYYEKKIETCRINGLLAGAPASSAILHDAYCNFAVLCKQFPMLSDTIRVALRQGIVNIQAEYFSVESGRAGFYDCLLSNYSNASSACVQMLKSDRALWESEISEHPELQSALTHFMAHKALAPKEPRRSTRDLTGANFNNTLEHKIASAYESLDNQQKVQFLEWAASRDPHTPAPVVSAQPLLESMPESELLPRLCHLVESHRAVDPNHMLLIAAMLLGFKPEGLSNLYTSMFAHLLILKYSNDGSAAATSFEALRTLMDELKTVPDFVTDARGAHERYPVYRLFTEVINYTVYAEPLSKEEIRSRLEELRTYCEFSIYHHTLTSSSYFKATESPLERKLRLKAYCLASSTEFDQIATSGSVLRALNILNTLTELGDYKVIPLSKVIPVAEELVLYSEEVPQERCRDISKILRAYKTRAEELEVALERAAVDVRSGELVVDAATALYFSQVGGGSKEFWQVVDMVVASEFQQLSAVLENRYRLQSFANLLHALLEYDYANNKDRVISYVKKISSDLPQGFVHLEVLRLIGYCHLSEQAGVRSLERTPLSNTVSNIEMQLTQHLRSIFPDVPFDVGLRLEDKVSMDIWFPPRPQDSQDSTGIPVARKPLAVQVDGDLYHFVDGKSRNGFDGNTKLRTAILQENGIDVIRIPVSYMHPFCEQGTPEALSVMTEPITRYWLTGETDGLIVVHPDEKVPTNIDRPVLFVAKKTNTSYRISSRSGS